MDYLTLIAGVIVGLALYWLTPKDGRLAMVTMIFGAVCGGTFASLAAARTGVNFFDPWTSAGIWMVSAIILYLTIRYMNKGSQINIILLFGFGFCAPLLAFFALLALIIGQALFSKGAKIE